MPSLEDMFRDIDSDLIDMVAEFWGMEDDLRKVQDKRKSLSILVNNQALFLEIIESLPAEAESALTSLAEADGRIKRELL